MKKIIIEIIVFCSVLAYLESGMDKNNEKISELENRIEKMEYVSGLERVMDL